MTKRDQQGRFRKGGSGNPKGKPKGARHAATLAAQALLEGEAEALGRKAVEMALGGDTVALRLCIERLLPPAKERPITGYELPDIQSPIDVLDGLASVAGDLAEGHLLPSQAAAVCGILEQYRKSFETLELEQRVVKLEEKLSGNQK